MTTQITQIKPNPYPNLCSAKIFFFCKRKYVTTKDLDSTIECLELMKRYFAEEEKVMEYFDQFSISFENYFELKHIIKYSDAMRVLKRLFFKRYLDLSFLHIDLTEKHNWRKNLTTVYTRVFVAKKLYRTYKKYFRILDEIPDLFVRKEFLKMQKIYKDLYAQELDALEEYAQNYGIKFIEIKDFAFSKDIQKIRKEISKITSDLNSYLKKNRAQLSLKEDYDEDYYEEDYDEEIEDKESYDDEDYDDENDEDYEDDDSDEEKVDISEIEDIDVLVETLKKTKGYRFEYDIDDIKQSLSINSKTLKRMNDDFLSIASDKYKEIYKRRGTKEEVLKFIEEYYNS